MSYREDLIDELQEQIKLSSSDIDVRTLLQQDPEFRQTFNRLSNQAQSAHIDAKFCVAQLVELHGDDLGLSSEKQADIINSNSLSSTHTGSLENDEALAKDSVLRKENSLGRVDIEGSDLGADSIAERTAKKENAGQGGAIDTREEIEAENKEEAQKGLDSPSPSPTSLSTSPKPPGMK